ncbi:MAG: helix-turn-helix transcriptional regulator [Planctomycetota bacterium]|jgi:predicted DNA-binding transcriptional regulator YafY
MPTKLRPLFRRLLAINRELRKGGTVNCRTLKELPEFEEFCLKTIQRDIDYMRDELKAPIDYDAKKRSFFLTEENFFVPALPMSEGEYFAIMIAEKILEQYRNTPLFETLKRIFGRIRGLLPEPVLVSPSSVEARYSFFFPPAAHIDPAVWEAASRAVSESRRLRLTHTSAGANRPATREVDPYHIVNHDGAWYVIGHCHLKDALRTFALSRVTKAEVLDTTFERPASFDIDKFMSKRFGIIWGEKEHNVRLRFSASHAPYVLEREWHPTQAVKKRRDGKVELTMKVNDLLEMKRWILSWGRGVEVLGPKVLRTQVREEAKEAAKLNR